MSTQTGWFEIVSKKHSADTAGYCRAEAAYFHGADRKVAMVSSNGPKIASVAIPERPKMPFNTVVRKHDSVPVNNQESISANNIENEVTQMLSNTVQKVHNQAVDVSAAAPRHESRTQHQPPLASRPQAQSQTQHSAQAAAGLELLDTEFVVSLVENVASQDRSDITMRIIGYNELLRRGEINRLSSDALVSYAKDMDCLYGKDMQCEAIKELARRTVQSNS